MRQSQETDLALSHADAALSCTRRPERRWFSERAKGAMTWAVRDFFHVRRTDWICDALTPGKRVSKCKDWGSTTWTKWRAPSDAEAGATHRAATDQSSGGAGPVSVRGCAKQTTSRRCRCGAITSTTGAYPSDIDRRERAASKSGMRVASRAKPPSKRHRSDRRKSAAARNARPPITREAGCHVESKRLRRRCGWHPLDWRHSPERRDSTGARYATTSRREHAARQAHAAAEAPSIGALARLCVEHRPRAYFVQSVVVVHDQRIQ